MQNHEKTESEHYARLERHIGELEAIALSIQFAIKKSDLTGLHYAVFADGHMLDIFHQVFSGQILYPFRGCRICCFDGYENAFELGIMH